MTTPLRGPFGSATGDAGTARPVFHPVEADGLRGRFAVMGRPCGSPVVLVGAPFARIEAYRPTLSAFARHGQTFAVELPGVGPTGRLAVPPALDDYAGWVARCLDRMGLSDATLIGHSHAGGVTLLAAANHPARIGRLVLANSSGTGPFSFWQGATGRLLDTLTVEFGLALRAWHHLAYASVSHHRNFNRQTQVSLEADLLPQAVRVEMPALVAWSARDHTFPTRCARRFADALPDASEYLSPGGSHCWPITHADEFAEAVTRWAGQPSPRENSASPHHTTSASSIAASTK